jgi:hypothetical protein
MKASVGNQHLSVPWRQCSWIQSALDTRRDWRAWLALQDKRARVGNRAGRVRARGRRDTDRRGGRDTCGAQKFHPAPIWQRCWYLFVRLRCARKPEKPAPPGRKHFSAGLTETLNSYKGKVRAVRALVTKPDQDPTTWCFAIMNLWLK